uniref:Si:dkey-25g12.4 n=1 Tax=Sander lucioperca TaxID=283035 RepID=A0A8D0D1B3_SANLU
MPGTARRGELPPTRTIIVYKNGDAFFSGRKIVVNPRYLSTFDNFLTFLTRGIEAPFGAVRRLYTPREGRKVQHLDDLKHGSVYVAAGNEQFKKLDYCEITTKKPQKKKKEQIQPVVHSRIVVSARWKRTTDESCTINVFTNGDALVSPARIRIPKYTLRSWENVLAMVTEKVRLRTGAVFRLCTLDGRPVCGPTELENNQYYVAVGAEKFKALPYDHYEPCREFNQGNQRDQTGSVFNAQNKRSETAGAAEVQEDRQVKVDLPIDQVKHCNLKRSLAYNLGTSCKINTAVQCKPRGILFSPSLQVEAKIVDEEYENGSCSASPCKASLHDSDNLRLQRSLSAGSRKDVSTLMSFM